LDPTTWTLDLVGLDRPGNAEIQLDLFLDYGTNVPLYPGKKSPAESKDSSGSTT
jgi:hypothetical protein